MSISYALSINGKKREYEDTIDGALFVAYLRAQDTNESVTLVQVDGDEHAAEFTPLCVITSLPVKS